MSDILSGEADVHSVAKKASNKHKEEVGAQAFYPSLLIFECAHVHGNTHVVVNGSIT